jgi:hypothetical protein
MRLHFHPISKHILTSISLSLYSHHDTTSHISLIHFMFLLLNKKRIIKQVRKFAHPNQFSITYNDDMAYNLFSFFYLGRCSSFIVEFLPILEIIIYTTNQMLKEGTTARLLYKTFAAELLHVFSVRCFKLTFCEHVWRSRLIRTI